MPNAQRATRLPTDQARAAQMPQHPAERWSVGSMLLLGLACVVVAMAGGPRETSAQSEPGLLERVEQRVVGELVGRSNALLVHAEADGARFSMAGGAGRDRRGERMDSDALQRAHPGVIVPALADTPMPAAAQLGQDLAIGG